MNPHFFGLDLTAALPWFLMGFLLSACILGLWSFLSGSRRAVSEPHGAAAPNAGLSAQIAELQEDLAERQADLDAARTSAMGIANEKVRIEAELKKSVRPVSPSAQNDPGLADQLIRLQADLEIAKSSALQYANEKSKLEVDLRKAALQVSSLMSAAAGASSTLPASGSAGPSDLDIRRRNEIADLNAELWALRKSYVDHAEKEKVLNAEIAKQKAQLSAPSPAELEVKRLTSDVAKWKAKVDVQATELSNKSGFIAMRDAELDRLEALLAKNNATTTAVVPNGAHAAAAQAPASAADVSKVQAEMAKLHAEIARISAELASKNNQIAVRDAELDRLEALVAKGQSGAPVPVAALGGMVPVSIAEATQYTSEIMRLRALVDQVRSELSEKTGSLAAREAELGKLQGQSSQVASYIAEHNHLRAEVVRLSHQNASLSLDIANYQRVRDALQEANLIATKS